MMGASPSLTVTAKEQRLELPDASVAVHITVVRPLANTEPDAGMQLMEGGPIQLSVAVGLKVTTAVQRPPSVSRLKFAGQVITGGSRSSIVTVNEHVLLLPEASVT